MSDDWKLLNIEIEATVNEKGTDDAWRRVADAAGRKALRECLALCEAEFSRWNAVSHCEAEANGASGCAAAIERLLERK